MTIRIWLDGSVYESTESGFVGFADPAFRDRLLRNGVFLAADGGPMDEVAQRRMRAFVTREDSLKGVSDQFVDDMLYMPQPGRADAVIPGLWEWETIPMLTGQPKAGKTTFAVQLLRALNVPGVRFLDYFEPTRLPLDSEIWFLNAETPVEAFTNELYDVGAYDGMPDERRHLSIEHLEVLGGPTIFDLTVPANFDLWASHFIDCVECHQTGDFIAPAVVIVDGLTAILGGNTDRYAEWYVKFRELLRYVGIPNGLVIAHSTMRGDHSMGGTAALAGPDGLWQFTSNERGRRLFSVLPRMGGNRIDPLQVVRDEEDHQLRVVSRKREPVAGDGQVVADKSPAQRPEDVAAHVLAFVAKQNADGIEPRLADIRSGVGGDGSKVSAVVLKLRDSTPPGLTAVHRKGRGGVAIHYRVEQVPELPIDGAKAEK